MELRLPPVPVRVHHDPQRIGQVVANLLGNAIKFTPRGGSVVVTLEPHRDGARLEVRDTGVGIDASEIPHIFDRFYRGSRANEARGSGSGLGLAIVKSIVDMHGGRISVESGVGTGTTFVVILPRDPKHAEEIPAPAHDRPAGRGAAAIGRLDVTISSPSRRAATQPRSATLAPPSIRRDPSPAFQPSVPEQQAP